MRVDSLVVKKLYGYIDFELKFYSDLNFLIGINGSGKTSILNVIAWLLTPSLIRLAQVDFSHIEVVCREGKEDQQKIIARKSGRNLDLSIEGIDEKLDVPIFEYPSELPMTERTTPSIPEMYERFRMEKKNHPVLHGLDKLGSPLYLPLDRRWEAPDMESRLRFRPYSRFRPSPRTGSVIESVLYLAERYYRERQFELGKLNEKLREDLVEYTFGDIVSIRKMGRARRPWRVEEIRKKRDTILIGLDQAGIRVTKEVVQKYFSMLEDIAENLEKEGPKSEGPDLRKIEWELNMPQVKKIEQVIKRMEVYNKERNTLLRTIDDFIITVNSFLCDTRKSIKFDSSGEISVELDGKHEMRAENLSSGEAQLLILFTYLYFGFQPKKKFLVMIDEPELSLHLNWQHRYVDSVIKANPDAQFIFATHAPEIGQGHGDRFIELSPSRN